MKGRGAERDEGGRRSSGNSIFRGVSRKIAARPPLPPRHPRLRGSRRARRFFRGLRFEKRGFLDEENKVYGFVLYPMIILNYTGGKWRENMGRGDELEFLCKYE